jgi:hypothetical protein
MATLQNRQRAKSDSDVKKMYGFSLPTPAHPAEQPDTNAKTICNQTSPLKTNSFVYLALAFTLKTEYDPSDFNVLYLKIEVTYDGFLHNRF